MNEQEAIKILHPDTTMAALAEIEYYAGFNGHMEVTKAVEDACKIACKALELRIPKDPIQKEGFMVVHRCPECNEVLPICQPCCGNCGQAIDWSEEE